MSDPVQSNRPTPARGFLWPRAAAFVVGFFTIGAQAALLREYLVLSRGSELAIGVFFSCWFLWVAAGATLTRRFPAIRSKVSDNITALAASYPLWAFLGLMVLATIRQLAGVPAYEPTPLWTLVAGAAVALAPVSLNTGFVFPALCDISATDERTGASTGYILESAGAFAGGLAATLAFRTGLDGPSATAVLAIPLATLVLARGIRDMRVRTLLPTSLACLLVLLMLVPPTGAAIRGWIARTRLDSNLSGAAIVEERHTPYQLLTLARVSGQDVLLADGSVEAVLQDGPDTRAFAALLASQSGSHERAVVLGQGGYPLARQLSVYFDEVDIVVLDHAVEDMVGDRHPSGNPEFIVSDPRSYVRQTGDEADLFVIAAPEPGTLLANRLYTIEFFKDLSNAIASGGMVATTFRSAENYVGTEFLRYGQSICRTLDSVFDHIAIVPGDQALVMASNTSGRLSLDPATLSESYRTIAPDPSPFPPDGFMTLLSPDRVEFIRDLYLARDTPSDLLNTDERPLASFLYLLTTLRESDTPGTRLLWSLHQIGAVLPAAVLLLLLMSVIRYRLRLDRTRGFSAAVLMSFAGGASISASVALLAAFQAGVGAVYGDVGLATGLFMGGLGLGAALCARLARDLGRRPALLASMAFSAATAVLFVSVPLVLDASRLADPDDSRIVFGALFLSTGILTGAAWPLASSLAGAGMTAARLESADHWGAALMAGITGVFVVSIFGLHTTFMVIGGLFALAGVTLAFDAFLCSDIGSRLLDSQPGSAFSFRSLPFGAAAAAIGFIAIASVLAFHLTRSPEPGMRTRLTRDELRRHESFTSDSFASSPFEHSLLEGVTDPDGDAVVSTTLAVAPDVKGYGGPMNFLLSVGRDGLIRRVAVLGHNETPAYVTGLPTFLDSLTGGNVRSAFDTSSSEAVDAMTGATVTRDAALEALNSARESIATGVLDIQVSDSPPLPPIYLKLIDPEVFYAVFAVPGAVLVHLYASSFWRVLFLAASLLVGGIIFNVQLSATWLLALFRLDLPPLSVNAPLFILGFGSLGVSILFGPIYCAHVCPFGSLQELIGRLSRRMGMLSLPSGDLSMRARGIKYLVLTLVALSLFFGNPADAVGWDPLAAVFSGDFEGVAWIVIGLALVGSMFFFRFWCRVFCPVGAFFLLFNRVAGLLGLGPARRYHLCDLGVQGPHDIECLQCNRCVRESGEPVSSPVDGKR